MKHSIFAPALVLALALGGVVHASDLDKINGDVHVTSGQSVGDVSTVNGDVRVDGKATVGKAETVNGSIVLDDHADVPALKGWRRKLFGEKALAIKHGRLALAATRKGVVEVPVDLE